MKDGNAGIRKTRATFAAAAFLLAVSVLGLRWATWKLAVVFAKKEVALRRSFETIPEDFGVYHMEIQLPPLSAEAEGALRANAYITRLYRDTRRPEGAPGSVIRLHLAYYTGTPDTVIHVPEICYVASGAQARDMAHERVTLISGPRWSLREDGSVVVRDEAGHATVLPGTEVPMRLFEFTPYGGDTPEMVTYFFVANGRYFGMPEGVRALVLDIRERYAYWCKVEVLVHGLSDRGEVMAAVREFLSAALPEVLACLPDWEQVKRS